MSKSSGILNIEKDPNYLNQFIFPVHAQDISQHESQLLFDR